ncbi:MAG: HINT domain-containing protein [Candidatus Accumulibacter sp.]|nr:HINT domain-containing protein [Accumulibacter sp.]
MLSQPEDGGERAFRPVINAVAHLDQKVYAVQIEVDGAAALTTVIATGNHPFWVEAPLVDEKHWLAAECLEPGMVVQLARGQKAKVRAAGLVRCTQHQNIGFAADDRTGVGIVLDLEKGIRLADDALVFRAGALQLGEPYLTPVYNFEVDGFHTYYVGDAGVWVHNTTCDMKTAMDSSINIAELYDACFYGDTLVLAESKDGVGLIAIEHVRVGYKVLSRDEITGEMAFKRVLKYYENGFRKTCIVHYGGPTIAEIFHRDTLTVEVTPEHPFWVQGKGWTAARDLKPGDEFLTNDGSPVAVDRVVMDPFESKTLVFNLEVEDFNTYFVGGGGLGTQLQQYQDRDRAAGYNESCQSEAGMVAYFQE